MTELWSRYCDGYTLAECLDGDIVVTCYEEEKELIYESPRVQEGMVHLWRFEEEAGSRVSDWKGDAHLSFEGPGDAEWIAGGGLRILEPGRLVGQIEPFAIDGGLTLEAWIKPAQTQAGRVLSWSENRGSVNLELRQVGEDYAVLCRGAVDGKPSLLTTGGLAVQQITHLAWTLDTTTQQEALYLNAWQAIGGTRVLESLGNFPLTVANVPELDRPWLGELHLLALYNWPLPEVAIQQNYDCGPHPEKVPVEPPVPPEEQPTSLVEAVRRGAWRRMGIPRNEEAALLKYARAANLGAPMTRECDVSFGGVAYVVQGFAGGIAYCQHGDWGNVQELEW